MRAVGSLPEAAADKLRRNPLDQVIAATQTNITQRTIVPVSGSAVSQSANEGQSFVQLRELEPNSLSIASARSDGIKKAKLENNKSRTSRQISFSESRCAGRDFSSKMGFQKIRRLPHAKDEDDSPKNDYTDDQIKIVKLGPGAAVFARYVVAGRANTVGPNSPCPGCTYVAPTSATLLAASRNLPIGNAAA